MLKARSDCLLTLRISFSIHHQATREGIASENIVIVARINEATSRFCALSSHRFSIIVSKTTIHLSAGG